MSDDLKGYINQLKEIAQEATTLRSGAVSLSELQTAISSKQWDHALSIYTRNAPPLPLPRYGSENSLDPLQSCSSALTAHYLSEMRVGINDAALVAETLPKLAMLMPHKEVAEEYIFAKRSSMAMPASLSTLRSSIGQDVAVIIHTMKTIIDKLPRAFVSTTITALIRSLYIDAYAVQIRALLSVALKHQGDENACERTWGNISEIQISSEIFITQLYEGLMNDPLCLLHLSNENDNRLVHNIIAAEFDAASAFISRYLKDLVGDTSDDTSVLTTKEYSLMLYTNVAKMLPVLDVLYGVSDHAAFCSSAVTVEVTDLLRGSISTITQGLCRHIAAKPFDTKVNMYVINTFHLLMERLSAYNIAAKLNPTKRESCKSLTSSFLRLSRNSNLILNRFVEVFLRTFHLTVSQDIQSQQWKGFHPFMNSGRCSHGIQFLQFILRSALIDIASVSSNPSDTGKLSVPGTTVFSKMIEQSLLHLTNTYISMLPSRARVPQYRIDIVYVAVLTLSFLTYIPAAGDDQIMEDIGAHLWSLLTAMALITGPAQLIVGHLHSLHDREVLKSRDPGGVAPSSLHYPFKTFNPQEAMGILLTSLKVTPYAYSLGAHRSDPLSMATDWTTTLPHSDLIKDPCPIPLDYVINGPFADWGGASTLSKEHTIELVRRRHELVEWEHPPLSEEDCANKVLLLDALRLLEATPSG